MKAKNEEYRKYLFIGVIIIALGVTLNAKSQIAISNLSEINTVKRGTTYVVMKDPASEKAKEYIEVFKNNWTISKIEFIKPEEIEEYLSPDNSFLTISSETHTHDSYDYHNKYNTDNQYHPKYQIHTSYSETYIYLELWTCDKIFLHNNEKRKKKKKFRDSNKIQVARIELFTDFETSSDPDKLSEYDYDGDGHIRNWSPGILKNYIQLLISDFNKYEKQALDSEILNEKELKNLKEEVLYIPDYVLIKFNGITGNETKIRDEEDILSHYNFKYKLIPGEELNQKILTDEKAFYYLIYVKSGYKYIYVMNSQSGEIIYSKRLPASHNIKSKDLTDLQEKIQGTKE